MARTQRRCQGTDASGRRQVADHGTVSHHTNHALRSQNFAMNTMTALPILHHKKSIEITTPFIYHLPGAFNLDHMRFSVH